MAPDNEQITDTTEIAEVRGWCLVKDTETIITFPKYSMGALYFCQACHDYIREKVEDSKHVFDPAPALLAKLRGRG